MNGGACSHYKNRPGFPGPRFVILREREAALPARDSGALRRIVCHREFSLLGLIVRGSPYRATELRQERECTRLWFMPLSGYSRSAGFRSVLRSPFVCWQFWVTTTFA